MHLLLGAAVALALVSPPRNDTAIPTAGQLRAWKEFVAVSGEAFEIRWHRSGAPRRIRRTTRSPRTHGAVIRSDDAQAIARRFVDANSNLFDLRPGVDDFAVTRAERAHDHWDVRVEQTYAGVPVEGGRYRLRLERDGSFESFVGSWVRDVGRESWIPPDEAQHRALEVLPPRAWFGARTELDRKKFGGRSRLVYLTRAGDEWYAKARVWVDPRTGSVLDHTVHPAHSITR